MRKKHSVNMVLEEYKYLTIIQYDGRQIGFHRGVKTIMTGMDIVEARKFAKTACIAISFNSHLGDGYPDGWQELHERLFFS